MSKIIRYRYNIVLKPIIGVMALLWASDYLFTKIFALLDVDN